MDHDEPFDTDDDLFALSPAERLERWTAMETRYVDIETDLFVMRMAGATSTLSQLIALDAERRRHSLQLQEVHGQPGALRLLTGQETARDTASELLVRAVRGSVVRAAALEIELVRET